MNNLFISLSILNIFFLLIFLCIRLFSRKLKDKPSLYKTEPISILTHYQKKHNKNIDILKEVKFFEINKEGNLRVNPKISRIPLLYYILHTVIYLKSINHSYLQKHIAFKTIYKLLWIVIINLIFIYIISQNPYIQIILNAGYILLTILILVDVIIRGSIIDLILKYLLKNDYIDQTEIESSVIILIDWVMECFGLPYEILKDFAQIFRK